MHNTSNKSLVYKTNLARQIEQTIGRPKQRQLADILEAPWRFALAAVVTTSLTWVVWWLAVSARRVRSLRRSGDSVLTRLTPTPAPVLPTLLPVFVNSWSMLSLVRQMLGFSARRVSRLVFFTSARTFNELASHEACDCCDDAVARFSSTPTFVLVNDDLYSSQHYHSGKSLIN